MTPSSEPPVLHVGQVPLHLVRSEGQARRYEATVGGGRILVWRAHSGDVCAWEGALHYAGAEAARVYGSSPNGVASLLTRRLRELRDALAGLELGAGT